MPLRSQKKHLKINDFPSCWRETVALVTNFFDARQPPYNSESVDKEKLARESARFAKKKGLSRSVLT